MKLQGEHTFQASRDTVWQALNDPEILARTLPGCERLTEAGENRFEGALNIRVGPVQGQFQGTVQLLDLEPPEGYRLELDGKGAPGFVQGKGSVRLEQAGGVTVMHYEVDTQVGGRIAGVGQRLLDSSARVITRQALEGLTAQIEALEASRKGGSGGSAAAEEGAGGEGGDAAAPRPAAPAAPSQTEFAAKFAKGMFEEMVPPRWRPVVVGGGFLVLLLLLFLIVRACGG
jgi:carbon monoxide dehydrogenase subunit G